MSQLNRLEWDSNFFDLEIAECHCNGRIELSGIGEMYDLIVVKTEKIEPISLRGYVLNFSESKITYSKPISVTILKDVNSIIFDCDFYPVSEGELFSLAYESGKFSRFNLDSNFSPEQFQNLYRAWVTNSLNKTVATKIFYAKQLNIITGFVTLKRNKLSCEIGLIGVKSDVQGQRIGSKLLNAVESYCRDNQIENLYVTTQESNKQACAFYEKNNFKVDKVEHIAHYWKVNTK